MITFVRTFTERVRQRRRFELAVVLLLGLAGLVMGGMGSNRNRVDVYGPNHSGTQETRRVVRQVVVAARAAARAPITAFPPLPRHARPRVTRVARPAAAALHGRQDRLPARVRGPPAAIVWT